MSFHSQSLKPLFSKYYKHNHTYRKTFVIKEWVESWLNPHWIKSKPLMESSILIYSCYALVNGWIKSFSFSTFFFVFQLFFSSFFPLMLRKFQVSEILKGSMRDSNPLLEHTIWRFKKVWRSEVFGLTFEWLMLLQALSMLQDTEKLLCDITSQWENDNSWYGDCRSPWRQSAIKCLF